MCLRVYSKIRLTGFTIGGEKQIEMQIKHDAFDFPWMSWFLKKIRTDENFFAEFYQEYKRPLGLLIFATDYF